MFQGKQWETISFSYPTLIDEVAEKMETISLHLNGAKWTIAGGCLSNAYMGKEIHDIDVFLEYNQPLTEQNYQFICSHFGRSKKKFQFNFRDPYNQYKDFNPLALLHFEHQGMKVEIIVCLDLKRVFDFDITLRHFFLYEKNIYVLKEALEDIKKKRISIRYPMNPLRTWIRTKQFEFEFGFQTDSLHEDLLHLYLSRRGNIPQHEIRACFATKEYSTELIQYIFDCLAPFEKKAAFSNYYYKFKSKKRFQSTNLLYDFFSHYATEQGIIKNVKPHEKHGVIGQLFPDMIRYAKKEKVFEKDVLLELTDQEVSLFTHEFVNKILPFLKIDRMQLLFNPIQSNDPFQSGPSKLLQHHFIDFYKQFIHLCSKSEYKEIQHILTHTKNTKNTESLLERVEYSDINLYLSLRNIISIIQEQKMFVSLTNRWKEDTLPFQINQKNLSVSFKGRFSEFTDKADVLFECLLTKDGIQWEHNRWDLASPLQTFVSKHSLSFYKQYTEQTKSQVV